MAHLAVWVAFHFAPEKRDFQQLQLFTSRSFQAR
jgi:hypothetical protein